ncbi:Predicted dehydrogenase [Pseudomonas sp. 8Z]|uniref:Gfo/Idh/MocA family protein n=1 Tax=Pseudomonas sp. 8Z TaxID=2653166 RepID=UPI0012F2783D|nr:Gfo/Idh/MocA family oxidoreductase [Pseudomonas sp. 8Z]VXC30732.1 Predicted dehydrogenase [Pseudomonas sp. 8Z]
MRIGLVGYGHAGRFFHAPLIACTPGLALVGVVTRSAMRRALVARDYPGVICHDSLTGLLDIGVDSVVIAAPLAERPALVLEAIARGVAVVSESPLATNLAEARAISDAAQQAGVALTVFHNRRWDSDVLTVARLLAQQALGRIRIFESRLQAQAPRRAGGLLLTQGCHLVDQACQLFGPVTQVYAEVLAPAGLPGEDDEFFLSLQHGGGVVSHLWGSRLQDCSARLRVVGEAGVYTVDGTDGQAEALLQGRTPRSEKGNWGVEEHPRWGWLHQAQERQRVPSERGCWPLFYQQWAATLIDGAPLPVEPDQALACQAILDAAQRSAMSRRREPVETIATESRQHLQATRGRGDVAGGRRQVRSGL